MFTLYGKIIKNSKIIADISVPNGEAFISRTQKVYTTLEQICNSLDLEKPIWLETNKQEFIKKSKTRFFADNFIETIDFDYLEISIIEEDY